MPDSRILLGVIGRPHGVRGLVRATSYADDLTGYGPLSDASGRRFVLRWRGEGVAEIAELVDGVEVKVADRSAAETLVNVRLYVDRAQLPEPEPDEFYLADLIGLNAFDAVGSRVGVVAAVHDYGAGASLEISREDATPLLLPFTRASVPVVDVAGARIVVSPPEVIPPPPNLGPLRAPSPQGEGGAVAASASASSSSLPALPSSSPSSSSAYGGRS